MADLGQWRSAVPAEDELVAAAPMFVEWRYPHVNPRRAAAISGASGLSGFLPSFLFSGGGALWRVVVGAVGVVLYLGLVGWLLLMSRRWRRTHPRPTGLAAALDRERGPVLLITRKAVLGTDMAGAAGFSGRVRPVGPAQPIAGLVDIQADGDRLVLGFEDGSEAVLLQRWPTPGATERVAALAAPVLRRREPASR